MCVPFRNGCKTVWHWGCARPTHGTLDILGRSVGGKGTLPRGDRRSSDWGRLGKVEIRGAREGEPLCLEDCLVGKEGIDGEVGDVVDPRFGRRRGGGKEKGERHSEL